MENYASKPIFFRVLWFMFVLWKAYTKYLQKNEEEKKTHSEWLLITNAMIILGMRWSMPFNLAQMKRNRTKSITYSILPVDRTHRRRTKKKSFESEFCYTFPSYQWAKWYGSGNHYKLLLLSGWNRCCSIVVVWISIGRRWISTWKGTSHKIKWTTTTINDKIMINNNKWHKIIAVLMAFCLIGVFWTYIVLKTRIEYNHPKLKSSTESIGKSSREIRSKNPRGKPPKKTARKILPKIHRFRLSIKMESWSFERLLLGNLQTQIVGKLHFQ